MWTALNENPPYMHTSSIGPLDGDLVLRALEHSATQLPRGGDAAPQIRINKLPDLYNVSRIHELHFLAKARVAPRIDRSFVESNVRHAFFIFNLLCEKLYWKNRFPYLHVSNIFELRAQMRMKKVLPVFLFSSVNLDADTNRARCRRTVKLFALMLL